MERNCTLFRMNFRGDRFQLKYCILIGNTIQNIGTRLARNLSYFGLSADTCSNSPDVFLEKLAEKNYDGLIFFILKIQNSTYSMISDLRAKYNNMKIYPIIFTASETVRQSLIEAGANKCFVMPYTDFSLCGEIICDFFNNYEMIIFPEIAEFLHKKRFSCKMQGFYYLCCAIKICLYKPEIIEKSVTGLYRCIAEEMNTSYSSVEKSLRTMLSQAFQKGVIFNDEIVHKRMKNKELILLLLDEFKNNS